MSEHISNNKRIAKNTMMLYIRMLLSVVVSLYTSRVVLEVLGVEDYGIYGLVGGVVAMFSFLNSTMAGATSRFLTFEMGKGNFERLKQTFSSALIIHIGIALLVCILAETVGMWFLCNKLVIPAERMAAAHWVFQFSVISMIVNFTQVPYNAAIIAHEKMDVYAYVELLNVFLKLGIVYLLNIGNFDKLILYAFMVLVVSVLIAFIYRLYCIINYDETKFSFVLDKEIIKPMFIFSGWEALGHLGFTFRTQGVNFVLNMFFGVALNAVTSIATVVQNTLLGFTNNVIVAVKPQIIKKYALGHFYEMSSLVITSIRFNLLIFIIINVPLIFCTDYILGLWLNEVPEGTSAFCKVLMWSNLISAISQLIYSAIQATGNLKTTSIVRNFSYISTPFILYLVFSYHDSMPILAYILILLSQFLITITDIIILKLNVYQFNLKDLIYTIVKSACVLFLLCILNGYAINLDCSEFLRFILVFIITTMVALSSFYFIIFNEYEKNTIRTIIKNFTTKIIPS